MLWIMLFFCSQRWLGVQLWVKWLHFYFFMLNLFSWKFWLLHICKVPASSYVKFIILQKQPSVSYIAAFDNLSHFLFFQVFLWSFSKKAHDIILLSIIFEPHFSSAWFTIFVIFIVLLLLYFICVMFFEVYLGSEVKWKVFLES